jgi:pyruvate,water dikinase
MRSITNMLRSIVKHRMKPAAALSFKVVFRLFKEILDSNNRALEIITDMGDTLGGDYIFDITYIRKTYGELFSAVGNSIRSFDALTQKRYPGIHDAFVRIDNQLRQLIDEEAPLSGLLVVSYEHVSPEMAREVGGKNASLAELKNRLKLDVPDGFAITTSAFDAFMEYNGLHKKFQGLGKETAAESACAELKYLIIKGTMPPALASAIDNAITALKKRIGDDFTLAVRSSAEEEDGVSSFAGQFETVLNVPPGAHTVGEAFKKVIASLYSPKAVTYQRHMGYDITRARMAVGCMVMADVSASGVMYSSSPKGDRNTLIINATWGLGSSVVEGRTDADFFAVRKGTPPQVLDHKTGKNNTMTVMVPEGGIREIGIPDTLREQPCLSEDQITELAKKAVVIEEHFREPQDIEWAVDRSDRIVVLQSRPLRIEETVSDTSAPLQGASEHALIRNRGIAVQKGIAAGKAFVLRHVDELDRFPRGHILVAKQDSSHFVRVMPYAAAIITDVGTPTSHMASVCREFRVPTAVNLGNATQTIQHGQEITVSIDDDAMTIFEGIRHDLLAYARTHAPRMEDVLEYRKKRYVLRYISPLNLIDPLIHDFTTEGCKTLHDILRFIHEKSVAELIERGRAGASSPAEHTTVKLELPVPAGILVVDIGGGLDNPGEANRVGFEQIRSIPLRALVRGMTYPGVWHSDMVSLKAKDFFSSMLRMSDVTVDSSDYIGYNVAVASKEYVNLSLRFGYHFNMLDCYCSENARNNHIYFRFVGGATDITKRSRRVQFIADILKEHGFTTNTKGDLIIARLANIRQDEEENILEQLGRLIAYTRQLDALLHDDSKVQEYARSFLQGNYEV